MELRTLYEQSSKIFLGTVESAEGRFENGEKTISTYVTLKAVKVYKGPDFKQITLRVPGGTVGEKTLKVFGAPVFKQDDTVLIFAEPDHLNKEAVRVSGFFQGRFMVVKHGGTQFAVMDQGRGAEALEICEEDFAGCLKQKGYQVFPLSSLESKILDWVIQDRKKK